MWKDYFDNNDFHVESINTTKYGKFSHPISLCTFSMIMTRKKLQKFTHNQWIQYVAYESVGFCEKWESNGRKRPQVEPPYLEVASPFERQKYFPAPAHAYLSIDQITKYSVDKLWWRNTQTVYQKHRVGYHYKETCVSLHKPSSSFANKYSTIVS